MITITATLDIHDPSCLGVVNSSLTAIIRSSAAVAQSIAAVCYIFLSSYLSFSTVPMISLPDIRF